MSHTYPYASPPFRKRRPKLFYFLVIVAIFALLQIATAVWSILDGKGVFSGPRLGLVTIEGFIGDAGKTVAWIEKLRKNANVAGVLIRIDSPGGGVAPSQEMHAAVKRLAAAKPVVVSMGAVAASGGYYIAVAGNEIFASPSTVTGSIGVRMQISNVQGLMERIGVSSESLTTGRFKAAGSPFKELTPEERVYLQDIIDDMQDEFVTAVSKGRGLPKETVKAVADGRIFTGRQALKAKLVDRLGDREAALAHLAATCRIDGEPEILEGPEKSRPWWRLLLEAAVDMQAGRAAESVQYRFCY